MKIIYSNNPHFTGDDTCSLFLAGPTPRRNDVPSWRPKAVEILEELNFSGTVLIPEIETGEKFAGYDNQIEWENSGLTHCTNIVVWLPRNMENMLGLTTNSELGYWLAKNPAKVYYGRPDGAPHTRYQDWLYSTNAKRYPENDLKELLKISICKDL
jgi:hypothetical protein